MVRFYHVVSFRLCATFITAPSCLDYKPDGRAELTGLSLHHLLVCWINVGSASGLRHLYDRGVHEALLLDIVLVTS
jgi:hypothetical protein